MTTIPEREIVAIRTEDAHGSEHVTRVKFADGSDEPVEDTIRAIDAHEAHYFMMHPLGRMLVRVVECPVCCKRVIWS